MSLLIEGLAHIYIQRHGRKKMHTQIHHCRISNHEDNKKILQTTPKKNLSYTKTQEKELTFTVSISE